MFLGINIHRVLILLLVQSIVICGEMWKISSVDGVNLSCTKLIEISNDSLHTEILGCRKSFAINDISRITHFKRNVNFAMLAGAGTGGIIGLYVDNYINRENKINTDKNGITTALLGAMCGTLMGHIISTGESINLAKNTLLEKKVVINSLICESN